MTGTLDANRAPSPTNTVALVTTFHPEPGLGSRLGALDGQVAAVIVVDNGSRPAEIAEVDVLERDKGFEVVRNGRNEGLAKALNQGLARARERGASYALLLDQDSTPLPGLVHEVGRIIESCSHVRVALVGTAPVGRPRMNRVDRHDAGWLDVPIVITSGTILAVSAWTQLGGFREDFFVDYVDIEFSLRARANGYRVLQSLRPGIEHRIGRLQTHRVLWRTVATTHHDAARRKGITANRMVVWRTYLRTEPMYVLRDLSAFTKEALKIVLLEGDRRAKLRSIRVGFRDGMRKTIAVTTHAGPRSGSASRH